MLAFKDKTKIIKSYVPEKVKLFIEKNLLEEISYFQKKYSIKIEILPDENLIIPEYKIELLNKSKKLIEKIENIDKIFEINKRDINLKKSKRIIKKDKKETKKIKAKKKPRTLWVRRKKKN